MNDRQDPHGAQFYGYDAYGRPIYHDPYGQPPEPTAPGEQTDQYSGHDPYAPYPGTAPSSQYDTGSYPPEPYETGSYPSHTYDTGDLPASHYPPGPYDAQGHDTGGYGGGFHDTGQLAAGQYDSTLHAPTLYDSPSGPGRYDTSYQQTPTATPYPPGAQPADPYGDPYAGPPGHGQVGAAAYEPPAYGAGVPPPAPSYDEPAADEPGAPPTVPQQRGSGVPETVREGNAGPEGGYQTEQFAFIEEPDEESEDVIDWLKFSESRTERREEAKRRARHRVIALGVVLALALVGGLGYLWQAGKLPGLGDSTDQAAAGAESRQVIVVHMRELESGDISTALLVNNETAGKGTTVLLPNSLALAAEGGEATTLGKSFGSEGAGATRDSLDALLGANIEGTWRLDTPYLENLVEMVGGITVNADATVPGAKRGDEPQVSKGKGRELDGQAAVAYATHRDAAEPQTKQLARFGQVMHGVLKKVSSDKQQAATTIESLGQILDFSLTEAELGRALAELAEHAKNSDYETELLPVQANGTLSEETAQGLVKEVLGGSVRNTDSSAAVRFAVRDASGERGAADSAQVALVNGGFTVVGTGSQEAEANSSTVTYRKKEHVEQAREAARTLGLSEKAVKRGEGAANADVTVVLGHDYGG